MSTSFIHALYNFHNKLETYSLDFIIMIKINCIGVYKLIKFYLILKFTYYLINQAVK